MPLFVYLYWAFIRLSQLVLPLISVMLCTKQKGARARKLQGRTEPLRVKWSDNARLCQAYRGIRP